MSAHDHARVRATDIATRHRRRLIATIAMALFAIPVVPPHAIATAATRPARPAPVLIDARHIDAAPRQESSGQPQATPSIVYEQAMEHAADRIAWQPGGRVSVGFSPRSDDGWVVGGAAPRRLPAGRATGREMAATGQGDSWAAVATTGNRTTASAVSVQPQATGLRRQVFGFLPYWEVASAASTLNYNVLSTIAYFSVGVDSSGNLRKRNSDGTTTTGWGGWTSANMTQVINAAHLKHTRVVLTLSVFAWTTSQASTQKAILGNATARLNLARQTAAAVRDRGADGVNLDFEPLATGYEAQFVSFVKTLRSELDAIAPGYQITFDTTGYIGNYPLAAATAPGAADAVFVMGYDYRTSGSGYAGSIDPAAGPGYDLADTIRAYSAAVPASKLVLGLPWYGRAWSTTAGTLNAKNQSGTKYGASVAVNYENVVGLAAQYGRHWDSRELSSWLAYQRQNCTTTYGCVTSWREVYYDDTTALRARYDLVNAYGLRGAGIWALGYEGGRAEMWKALADKFLNDTTPPDAGIVIPPSREVDEGFVIRWTAADDSSVVSYDVQVSVDGGAWTTWLAGTSATSDVYLGRDGHGYAFRVRARDSKGNLSSWNVSSVYDATPTVSAGGFARVTLDGLAYRPGPDTSAQRLGTLNAGTIVAITGGPVSADGYTWWEVTQPIREWGPVSFVERGVWIAGRSATASNVAAYRAPNSTVVDAGLVDFAPGDAVGSLDAGTTASARAFSPNGDGTRDTLRLRWTNSVALDSLTLNVLKTDGTVVGSRPVAALAAGQRAWDWDAAVTSSALPDGSYLLQLVGKSGTTTYRAPSSRPATATQVASYAVTIDTVPPAISSAVVTSDVISPNGDGYRDALGLSLAASDAASWTVTVRDGSGATVRTMSGSGSTTTLAWDGRADDGSLVADGAYRIAATARDAAGNSATRTLSVAVDTHAPTVTLAADPASFSPNGDRWQDATLLRWTATESATGTLSVFHGTALVTSWTVGGTTGSRSWNGRNGAGLVVPDGHYRVHLDLHDAAGNHSVRDVTVVVDRTVGKLVWSRSFYPQDGDSIAATSTVSFTLTRAATATLRILDDQGRLVRTVWTARALGSGGHAWTWNGRTAAGTYVRPGRYLAELVARSTLGTSAIRRRVTADAFSLVTPPASARIGQPLTIRFRTVEPLATRPTVTFTQPGRAAVTRTSSLLADGSYSVTFVVAVGAAGSGSIRIAARDVGGHANVSTMTLPVVL